MLRLVMSALDTFNMVNDYSKNLISEAENFINQMEAGPEFREKEHWIEVLFKDLKDFKNQLENPEDFESLYSRGLNFIYFFAPRMGSFSEVGPKELMKFSARLMEVTKDFLRFCWRKQGKETYNVDQSELYDVGDKVNLVRRQLMYISFGGHKEYADFETNHTYEVIEILEKDVTNMPQYLLKLGNNKRVARHTALARADI